MATVILGFAGSAYAGPIGGLIGSSVGSLIDNLIFGGGKGQKSEGPRLQDKRVTAATYGIAVPLAYGPEVRMAGNVIWSTDIIETKHKKKQKSGGKGGGSSSSITTYTYSVSLATSLSARPGTSIKTIFANGKKIYDATTSPPTYSVFSSLTFYPGDGAQTPDPTIEANIGVGLVPAYRFTCYCVINNLQLADFGNAVPNLEFIFEADTDITVAGVILDICTRAGFKELEAVPGELTQDLQGYLISSASTAGEALQPLAAAYAFDAAEQHGQIRFRPRGRAPLGIIPLDDCGGRPAADDPIEPIRFDEGSDLGLPQEVSVTYSDPELDYQTNTQTAKRDFGEAESNVATSLPLTLSKDEAKRIAERLLWESWISRAKATFKVTDKWLSLQAGDVASIPYGQFGQLVRIDRKTRTADGVTEMSVRFDDPAPYNSEAVGIAGILPDNDVLLPGDTNLILLDMPILADSDDDTGYYWAIDEVDAGWRGMTLKRSTDGGDTYEEILTTSADSAIGNVTTALPDGSYRFTDRSNTLTVVFPSLLDALESVTPEQCLNGANAAWLGGADGLDGELLQFETATLTSPGTYELTNLHRGRLGTEFATGAHGTNEIFILLEEGQLHRSDFGPADWNKTRSFKPVSLLQDEASATEQDFMATGEGKRPLSPVHVRGTRDGSNNLTITWHRRTRLQCPGMGNGPVPLGEETESYEVDIMSGATVLRTIGVTSETASYTAASQTSDGLTPGNNVTCNIYQLSTVRGRGRQRHAII